MCGLQVADVVSTHLEQKEGTKDVDEKSKDNNKVNLLHTHVCCFLRVVHFLNC